MIFPDRVVELHWEGSVINEANPSNFQFQVIENNIPLCKDYLGLDYLMKHFELADSEC